MMKRFKELKRQQQGFTLIEILVVIAILAVLAGIAVPNVGKMIGRGEAESYQAELHNLQTGVTAMIASSGNGALDSEYTDISDMSQVKVDGGSENLTVYMTGLNPDGTVKTGCTYTISRDGNMIMQSTPH
jgi:prepilin-type N-terminal cleavage/methylation domain-containing protein